VDTFVITLITGILRAVYPVVTVCRLTRITAGCGVAKLDAIAVVTVIAFGIVRCVHAPEFRIAHLCGTQKWVGAQQIVRCVDTFVVFFVAGVHGAPYVVIAIHQDVRNAAQKGSANLGTIAVRAIIAPLVQGIDHTYVVILIAIIVGAFNFIEAIRWSSGLAATARTCLASLHAVTPQAVIAVTMVQDVHASIERLGT
jgi:hypothetical protein